MARREFITAATEQTKLLPGFPVVFDREIDPIYRYVLWRLWDESRIGLGYVCMMGTNPSTADAFKPDPTITRVVDFADRLGYGALCMINVHAFRSPYPSEMRKARDPVGPDNDKWIDECALKCSLLIGAWGNEGARGGRALEIRRRLIRLGAPPMHALSINEKSGEPGHPLYLPKDSQLILLPTPAPETLLDD